MKPRLAAAFAAALTVTTLTSLAQSYNIRDLGAVAGQTQSAGFALNALGQAAGDSSSPSGPVNLNTLIPANSGYTLTDSIAIDDSGQILCDASTPTNPKHAGLLSPK